MNVDMDATTPPPPQKNKTAGCTCLLRARATRLNFSLVLPRQSQVLISASQYSQCCAAEAAGVILTLFTSLTLHVSAPTVANMGSMDTEEK